jgi:hypothetical protein
MSLYSYRSLLKEPYRDFDKYYSAHVYYNPILDLLGISYTRIVVYLADYNDVNKRTRSYILTDDWVYIGAL